MFRVEHFEYHRCRFPFFWVSESPALMIHWKCRINGSFVFTTKNHRSLSLSRCQGMIANANILFSSQQSSTHKIMIQNSKRVLSRWRHQMETFSALLALSAGKSPVPVNSPHKGQWRGALMFSLIYAWINDWVNNREAGDLRRHRGHYDVNVMCFGAHQSWNFNYGMDK